MASSAPTPNPILAPFADVSREWAILTISANGTVACSRRVIMMRASAVSSLILPLSSSPLSVVINTDHR